MPPPPAMTADSEARGTNPLDVGIVEVPVVVIVVAVVVVVVSVDATRKLTSKLLSPTKTAFELTGEDRVGGSIGFGICDRSRVLY